MLPVNGQKESQDDGLLATEVQRLAKIIAEVRHNQQGITAGQKTIIGKLEERKRVKVYTNGADSPASVSGKTESGRRTPALSGEESSRPLSRMRHRHSSETQERVKARPTSALAIVESSTSMLPAALNGFEAGDSARRE